jgi:hypothetical protein
MNLTEMPKIQFFSGMIGQSSKALLKLKKRKQKRLRIDNLNYSVIGNHKMST